jgi:hypothetical protein
MKDGPSEEGGSASNLRDLRIYRSAVPPHLYRDRGSDETYEVTFARAGRIIETVSVRAPSEEVAIARAQNYLFANTYPVSVNGRKIDSEGRGNDR